jgi:O-antigen/teichoic acid export membrane protein
MLTTSWRRLFEHSLLRNGAFLIATTISTSVLGYLYWWAAAHTASTSSVGLATGVVSALTLTAQVGTMGAKHLAIQILPSLQGRAWSMSLWRMVTWTGAVSFCAAVAVGWLLPLLSPHFDALRRPPLLMAFCLGAALTASANVVDAALISLRRSNLQFLRNSIFGVVKLALLALLWLVTRDQSAVVIVWTWVGGLLVAVGAALSVILPAPVRLWPRFRDLDPRPFFRQWRLLAGNFASSTGSLLPVYACPVLVVALLDAEHNAYYFIAWSVSAAFLMISSAIAQALFAETSTASEARQQVRVAAIAILVLLVPITAAVMLLAHPLLSLFGPEYAEHGVALLRINALAAYPDAITAVYIALMLASRRVTRAAVVNLVIGVATVGCAAVTLRTLGINAVGWSWLAAQVLGVLVMVLYMRRDSGSRRQYRDVAATARL